MSDRNYDRNTDRLLRDVSQVFPGVYSGRAMHLFTIDPLAPRGSGCSVCGLAELAAFHLKPHPPLEIGLDD